MDNTIQILIDYANSWGIDVNKEVVAWLDGLLTYDEAYNRLAAKITQATRQ